MQSVTYHGKRGMDLAISVLALGITLPLCAAVALAIRLETKGSPLFFQERIGRGSKPFHIVKFRSMVTGAENMGTRWTQENDARITRVGAFIRKVSLDELPQLWNVLMGDMSLIGPRPVLASERDYYSAADWQLRHSMRPGITGLAQVNGRSLIGRTEQIAYDLVYVKHPTLAMDLKIILKTIEVVLLRKGTN
jgi:lipopolysaccharide/colanic/teichoic acid biosynthesis glycosyltransferase